MSDDKIKDQDSFLEGDNYISDDSNTESDDLLFTIAEKIYAQIFENGVESMFTQKDIPEGEVYSILVMKCPTQFFEKYYRKIHPKFKLSTAYKAISTEDKDDITEHIKDESNNEGIKDDPILLSDYSKYLVENTLFYKNLLPKLFENLVN